MKALKNIIGFLPYLSIVFLNAFVDLGHKIIIQNTVFKTYSGETLTILTALVNALILLPFLLVFSTSGFLSDRFAKHSVMRHSALAAIGITLLITLCYYQGWFIAAFAFTVLLATQSAIYSPAKYGYIRELVGDENIASGNAAVQAVTIVAILAGTFAFSIGFEALIHNATNSSAILQNIAWLGWALVACSVLEYVLTLRLPKKQAGDKNATLKARELFSGKLMKGNLQLIYSHRIIWQCIIALSLFWAISQVVLSTFPAHAKLHLGFENTVLIQGILASTGIGIMLGSVIASYFSRHHIELGLIVIGALGVAFGVFAVPMLSNVYALIGLFLSIGICGAFLLVPLNSLIQYHAKSDKMGTILAGNNWVQNVAMLLFLIAAMALANFGINEASVFYICAAIAFIGFGYSLVRLPWAFARIIFSLVIKRKYQFSVIGFESLPKTGGVLLLGNHVSWIDWLLIQVAYPRPVRFVMLQRIYDTWYLKPIFKFFNVIPISAGNSDNALQAVRECLQNGEVVCLFPEGALSRNGQMGSFRSGYEHAVKGVDDAVIVPFYLHGLWGSRLSHSKSAQYRESSRQHGKRNVIVAFGEVLPLATKTDTLKSKVYELSIDAWELQRERFAPIPLSWLRMAKSRLFSTSVIDSALGNFSNLKMIATTLIFAKIIKRHDSDSKNIGILLPSSAPGVIVNLAVMLLGKTAVNINYTTSVKAVQSGIENAQIKTVVTANKFLQKLTTRGIDANAMLQGCDVLALEEVRKTISKPFALLMFLCTLCLPANLLYRFFGQAVNIHSPAQILFSSGSEGTPKGIVLSHANIQTNINQVVGLINPQRNDKVLGALPIFHSFGLTVTSFMPMLEGLPCVTHADPTDVLSLSKLIAKHKVTFMCATATFLRLYVRNKRINAQMLESLRFVIAGAEKVSDEVRTSFESKFKKTIFEGYGATETAPVATSNNQDMLFLDNFKLQQGNKPGTVGMPLPGTSIRIVDPQSYQTLATGEDGLILISGGQVMLGYLNDEEKTQQVLIELEGRVWYKTGDKGHLDEDGFLTIVDRYSRFAKIGGEMVSLASVEQAVMQIIYKRNADTEVRLAVTALADEKKGEKIVLLLEDNDEYDEATLRQLLLTAKLHPLMLPSHIITTSQLPILGSGKKDFAAIKQLAVAVLEVN